MLTNSNFYIGDSSVSRLYQGENLIWDASHPDILLEYIANGPDDGAANPDVYFDTGFTPQLSTRAEVKFESPTLAIARVFGCGNSATASSMFNLNYYANGPTPAGSNKMSLKFFYRGGAVSAPFTPEINTPYTVSLFGIYSGNTASEINMIVNGTKYTRSVDVQANITDGQSAYIFRWHGNVNETPAGVKFYYVKIWSDNNLIRFYIPVLHYINGQYTPCFYDKVNDTYIYNLGTDTPTYKIQGDYLLDWVGSMPETSIPDASAFYVRYDSGVVASNKLQVDVKGRLVWGREQYLYGSGTTNQTTPAWQNFGFATSGGSTNADKMRFRVDCGANGTTNYRIFIADSSAISTVNRISHFFDENRAFVYLNDTLYNSQSPVPDKFSTKTMHILARQGDNSVTQISKGARIYYINFTTSNIPEKTAIPVFHNGKPELLDLNSGTYLQLHGNTSPYYQFINPYPDIPLTYIANGPDSDVNSVKDVYFNTGVIANVNTKCEMKTSIPAYKAQWFAGGVLANYSGFEIGVSAYNRPYTRIGTYLESGQSSYSSDIQLNTPYTVTLYHNGTNQITVFDNQTATTTSGNVNAGSFSTTQPVLLFVRGADGTVNKASSYSGMKIYYVKFWSSNNIVHSYVPVLHYINGQYTPCFYDEVTDNYIYNLGTDTPVYSL